jgi:predicted nucleic acid-binding protein
MIATGAKVFVDTSAFIALAIVRDPLHDRAKDTWAQLRTAGARVYASVPVVLETFTYLDRRGSRELAGTWRASLASIPRFQVLSCTGAELEESSRYLDRKEFHKLGLVDASSFVLMKKHGIRMAFAFDTHFAIAGFRYAQ